MVKTSANFEQEFIQTVREKTGKTLEQWLSVAKSSGFSGQGDLIDWLKTIHHLSHLQASLLTGIFLNHGHPVYQHPTSLLENQLDHCEAVRPLFHSISYTIISRFPDTRMIAKKAHVSYTAIREFAAIQITPQSIYLGLDLGKQPFNEPWLKSFLKGPSGRITHLCRLNHGNQLNNKLVDCLTISYQRSHHNSSNSGV